MTYRVEWDNREGNRRELTFARLEDAELEAAILKETYSYVNIVHLDSKLTRKQLKRIKHYLRLLDKLLCVQPNRDDELQELWELQEAVFETMLNTPT